ncbi:MAG TPA: serine hydrolase domain-containing protein [Myxococcota bacterium]|nr:serine hydrolase domain-containing protein [Myxococcota bacterium]
MRSLVEPDFAPLEQEMARQLASGLRPTLQVAVDWRGRAFERALGPGASADASYVLWSSTKPLVAVALLSLVEEGKLALDAKVAQHLPEFGRHGKERVTVAQLLSHRGGFPATAPEQARALARASRDWDEALRLVCELPLAWEPGSDRGYHPLSAWFVVGELVQRLDGRPLSDALRARVLDPLAIPRDGFSLGRPSDLAAPPLAVTTREAKGAPPASEAAFWNDPRTHAAVLPAGGGIARARTLVAFYRALLDGGRGANGRLLSPEMVRTATFPHVVGIRDRTFLRDIPWGLGFHLKHVLPALDDCGTRATPGTFGHAGHFVVNTAFADPGRDLAVAILSNGLAEPRAGLAGVTALADAVHASIDAATGAGGQ